MIGLKRGTVRLAAHQGEWINEAENTIKELKSLLGDTAIDIQHIGSTAIPLIHAKPIIDIVIGVQKLSDIQPYIGVLQEKGFVFRGEDVSGQALLVKGDFEKDDIVKIIDEKGRQIGVGCAAYDSNEARSLIGKRDIKPLIHYDYLYLD